MLGLKTAVLIGGLAVAGMAGAAPVAAAPLSVAGAIDGAPVRAAAHDGQMHEAGYYGYRRGRHPGWRPPYGHRRGRTVVIERPCSTRIVRKTRRGRIVRVIEHCRPYHRGRYRRW